MNNDHNTTTNNKASKSEKRLKYSELKQATRRAREFIAKPAKVTNLSNIRVNLSKESMPIFSQSFDSSKQDHSFSSDLATNIKIAEFGGITKLLFLMLLCLPLAHGEIIENTAQNHDGHLDDNDPLALIPPLPTRLTKLKPIISPDSAHHHFISKTPAKSLTSTITTLPPTLSSNPNPKILPSPTSDSDSSLKYYGSIFMMFLPFILYMMKSSLRGNPQAHRKVGNKMTARMLDIINQQTISDFTNSMVVANYTGKDGAVSLTDTLLNNSAIVVMNLAMTRIAVSGAEKLAEMLKTNQTLVFLDIEFNSVGNQGAIALAEALKQNYGLIRLGLSFNGISQDGALALHDALIINKNIIALPLYMGMIKFGNVISREMQNKIQSLINRNIEIQKNFVTAAKKGDIQELQKILDQHGKRSHRHLEEALLEAAFFEATKTNQDNSALQSVEFLLQIPQSNLSIFAAELLAVLKGKDSSNPPKSSPSKMTVWQAVRASTQRRVEQPRE